MKKKAAAGAAWKVLLLQISFFKELTHNTDPHISNDVGVFLALGIEAATPQRSEE